MGVRDHFTKIFQRTFNFLCSASIVEDDSIEREYRNQMVYKGVK